MFSLFTKIRQKIRHGLVFQVLLDNLASIGLEFMPFYIFREGLSAVSAPNPVRDSAEYEWGFLGMAEADALTSMTDRNFSREEMEKRLTDGMICYGVKCQGEVAAFTWANLKECHARYHPFPLKSNEAYLFDAYTMKPFRGRNLAPVLRYRLCEVLASGGRDAFYSYSIATNTSAIRFKQKLGAYPVKLCLFVELFRRWHWLWILREYSKAN